jgi:dihydrodipicolinate synthase/N-acetylneuraminate lyase
MLGTTGECMLFSPEERREIAAAFVEAGRGRFQVAVHAGAQNTRDTVALAAHAAEIGADAVAVIAPPYFPLDMEELYRHFAAAAGACAPTPFYMYEFEARSGYRIPAPVIEYVRERAPNLAGMKVSDSPWEKVAPYLLDGLDIFIGAEALLARGLAAGAAGAVSGLASCFPDAVVPLVRDRTPEAQEKATALRADLQRLPFHAAAKTALGLRGVPVAPEVRAPLRGLTEAERAEVERILEEWG